MTQVTGDVSNAPVGSKHGSSGPMQKSLQHTQDYVSQYIHLVGMLFEMNCDSGFNDLNLLPKHDASGPMQRADRSMPRISLITVKLKSVKSVK